MQTRQYPRTLEQAFGPYARNTLVEKTEPMPTWEKVVITLAALATLALGIAHFTN